MHVGVLRVYFQIFTASTLKEKRQVMQSIKGRVQSRFNVSVGEIGSQDAHTAGELGIAMVGSDKRYVNGAMDKVLTFIESNPAIRVIEHALEMI